MITSQRLSDTAIASRVHPRTGVPIVPLGHRPDGRPIWPIMGGSGEEDDKNDESGASGADDEADESDDDEDDPEGSDESDKGSDGDADKDPKKKITALESEKDRQYRRRKEAERRADELQEELEQLKNKDKPEADLLKKENETLKSSNDKLGQDLTEARLQIAFLQDNTYEWHNPGRALQLADLSEVEIDDDGQVHGLSAALEKLAQDDPYLVKTKGQEDDKKDPPKKAGTPPKKKKDSDDAANRKKLLEKYPGLRR